MVQVDRRGISAMLQAIDVTVRGRVQGVGFRPFIFQIAHANQVRGTVQNNMDGVKIHVEGEQSRLEHFLSDLENTSPRLSKINEILTTPGAFANHSDFTIIPSERTGTSMLVLPIDSAVCDECLEEMNNPDDFRYQYPFINCTQCGPRYTIISDLPYDRPYTSMKEFAMCPECRNEYEDPMDRRHHAQPIACPVCGPSVMLFDAEGEISCPSPVERTIEVLKKGEIVAIKGIGGYHLCCDATNENAVAELRKRKKRPARPLAVMASDLNTAAEFVEVTDKEIKILKSPEAPIVVLPKKDRNIIAENVAPGMETIGVMLPYTPLHHLLFKQGDLKYLVMTSANPSGQPILYADRMAREYLAGIADYFLIHNREILHPADDSVVQVNGGELEFFRRSRGYVPDPIASEIDVNGIVAFGGQQKTAFTIGRNQQIFVGPHIGDLENVETIEHYKKELNHLLNWIDIPFQTAVIDMHPSFNTREIIKDYPFKEVIEVQHHHAHMAACMADNGLRGDAWGIILDGTGYGEDGNIWGFEIFHGNEQTYERKAHLAYTPLPGGEIAVKQPWRTAAGMLIEFWGEQGAALADAVFPEKKKELAFVKAMMEIELNSPLAGTCGRLFDAVSAITGICKEASYEGEAAIRLSEIIESVAEDVKPAVYHFDIQQGNGLLIFDFSSMIKKIAEDVMEGIQGEIISLKFHETIVQAIVTAMETMKKTEVTREVVLSGGSFHNRFLHRRIKQELENRGFVVYSHKKIPCNDGGISYGQLVAAAARRGK